LTEDDQGVFATSLSKEFYLVQSAFNLSTLDVIRLAGKGITLTRLTADAMHYTNHSAMIVLQALQSTISSLLS
jgi:hypothetical protein